MPRIEMEVWPGVPPESICTPGKEPAMSTRDVTWRSSSCSLPTTLMDVETSRAFSLRFCAVTSTTWRPPLSGLAVLPDSAGAEAAASGAAAACACAGVDDHAAASAAEAIRDCLNNRLA